MEKDIFSRKHTYSDILNFNDDFYDGIDYVINLFFDTYVSLREGNIENWSCNPSSSNVNIYDVKEDYLNNFILYGLILLESTANPHFIEVLLLNAREHLLNKCNSEERALFGLQLLYVVKSVTLLRIDPNEYCHFSDHFATNGFDMPRIRKYFGLDRKFMDSVKFCTPD